MSTEQRSELEAAMKAWGGVLADFRNWLMPNTKFLREWKQRELKDAIAAVPGRMIDDSTAMLEKWRQHTNGDKQGSTSFLPVMLTAMAVVTTPPDVSTMYGIPYWIDTVLPNDPQKRRVQMRTIPKMIRAQVVFICTEPHSAGALTNQLCAYFTDEAKRRFKVQYHVGDGIQDDWDLTIIENSLYPDSIPTDQKNLSIAVIDLQMCGLEPQVVGLDADDAAVDPGGRKPAEQLGAVVVQSDIDQDTEEQIHRINADPLSEDITESKVDRP